MERRRRLVREERARHFGTGSWGGVFRIGPRRNLLNHRASATAEPPPPPPSPSQGSGSVDPSRAQRSNAGLGKLIGGLPGQTRDLALAVNGSIRAVGQLSHQGDPVEYFSLTFPERHLRRGPNTFQLFEVREPRRARWRSSTVA